MRRGGRDRRDRQRGGVRREYAARLDDPGQPLVELVLELQRLGSRLDDELAARQVLEALRRLEPLARRGRLLGRPPPPLNAALELALDALDPARKRLGDGVVEQRARGGLQAGELRDPGAHRPGADDPDDRRNGTVSHATRGSAR